MSSFEDIAQRYTANVHSKILESICSIVEQGSDIYRCASNVAVLRKAMQYSLFAPSKLVRSTLFVATMELLDCESTPFFPVCVAIEMLHTSSLIHDDLPALDNALLRRGKPACHCVFGEANAILTGDALLTDAFYILATMLPAQIVPNLVALFAKGFGSNGVLGGQVLDIANNTSTPTSLEDILTLYGMKTGALIESSCFAGVVCAKYSKNVPVYIEELLLDFAKQYGIFFQIWDDILDVISSSEEIGKTTALDEQNEKASVLQLQGFHKTLVLLEESIYKTETILERVGEYLGITKQELLNQPEKQRFLAYAFFIESVQTMQKNRDTLQTYIKQNKITL